MTGRQGRKRVMGAQRTVVDGITFHSKREARRWQELLLLQAAGQISELQRQVPIPLMGESDNVRTPTGRKMQYLADFTYIDHSLNDVLVIEDAKGFATEVYKIKKAILAAQGVSVTEV